MRCMSATPPTAAELERLRVAAWRRGAVDRWCEVAPLLQACDAIAESVDERRSYHPARRALLRAFVDRGDARVADLCRHAVALIGSGIVPASTVSMRALVIMSDVAAGATFTSLTAREGCCAQAVRHVAAKGLKACLRYAREVLR